METTQVMPPQVVVTCRKTGANLGTHSLGTAVLMLDKREGTDLALHMVSGTNRLDARLNGRSLYTLELIA